MLDLKEVELRKSPCNLSLSLSLSLSLFLVTGCVDHKRPAKGIQNRVIVFSSSEDLPNVSSTIEKVFDRFTYTPEPEPYFELEYRAPSDFDDMRHYHNIIIVSLFSPVDSTGDVLVRSLLPKNQYKTAVRGENHIFSTRDYYSRGQVLAILAANTEEDLSRSLERRGRWLYDQFDAAFLERMKRHIFKTMEQKRLSNEFEEKYGWRMRLQHDYVVIQEIPEENFVWLGRSFPYRWLSIHWVDNPPAKKLDAEIAAELVRNLPGVFYRDIRLADHYQRSDQVQLGKWEAWRIEGLWEHKSEVKGGPFVSYLFYDEPSDRFFHINCLIHYPGGKKIILLREMETMVYTFSTS